MLSPSVNNQAISRKAPNISFWFLANFAVETQMKRAEKIAQGPDQNKENI